MQLFVLPCLFVIAESESHSVVSDSLQPHGLYIPWNSQAKILDWIAFPFSSGPSHPKGWTQVSRIAGRIFTSWVTREALPLLLFSC